MTVHILPTATIAVSSFQTSLAPLPVVFLDCSGAGRHRQHWYQLHLEADAVLFVIDSTDPERMDIVKRAVADVFESDSTPRVPKPSPQRTQDPYRSLLQQTRSRRGCSKREGDKGDHQCPENGWWRTQI